MDVPLQFSIFRPESRIILGLYGAIYTECLLLGHGELLTLVCTCEPKTVFARLDWPQRARQAKME
jgi:hypothetical protein